VALLGFANGTPGVFTSECVSTITDFDARLPDDELGADGSGANSILPKSDSELAFNTTISGSLSFSDGSVSGSNIGEFSRLSKSDLNLRIRTRISSLCLRFMTFARRVAMCCSSTRSNSTSFSTSLLAFSITVSSEGEELELDELDELELDVVSTGFSIIVDIMSNKIGIDRIQNLQQKIWKNNTKETNLETPPNEITQRTEHPHVLKATIRMTKEWREDRSLEFRFMLIASRPSANHRRPPHRGRLLIGRMAGLSPTSLPIGNLPAMVKSGDQDVITRI